MSLFLRVQVRRWFVAAIIDQVATRRILNFEKARFLDSLRNIAAVLAGPVFDVGILLFIADVYLDLSRWLGVDLLLVSTCLFFPSAFFRVLKKLEPKAEMYAFTVTAFLLGVLAMWIHFFRQHYVFTETLLDWVLLEIVAFTTGRKKRKVSAVVGITYLGVGPLLGRGLFPAIVVFLMSISWDLRRISRRIFILLRAVLGSKKLRAFVRYLSEQWTAWRQAVRSFCAWCGPLRLAALISFGSVILADRLRDRVPVFNEILGEGHIASLYCLMGVYFVLLSTIPKERPIFSFFFCAVGWLGLLARTVQPSSAGLAFEAAALAAGPATLVAAAVLVLLLKLGIARVTRRKASFGQITGLGPLGYVTLVLILAVLMK